MAGLALARVLPDPKAIRPFVELVNQPMGPLLQVVVYLVPMAGQRLRVSRVDRMAESPRVERPKTRTAMRGPPVWPLAPMEG